MFNFTRWQKFLIIVCVILTIGIIIAIQAAMTVIGYVLAFAIILFLIIKFGFKSKSQTTETPE